MRPPPGANAVTSRTIAMSTVPTSWLGSRTAGRRRRVVPLCDVTADYHPGGDGRLWQEMRERARLKSSAKTTRAHRVSRADATTGYAIFDAAGPLADGELLGVNQPCVAMLRHDHDRLHCARWPIPTSICRISLRSISGETASPRRSSSRSRAGGNWPSPHPRRARPRRRTGPCCNWNAVDGLTTTVNLIPRP